MNCETCAVKLPTLKTRLTRVNDTLHKLGLKYHDYLPIYDIDSALEENGFTATTVCATTNFRHEEVGDGRWLTVTCHRMESGRYEVVAYVN